MKRLAEGVSASVRRSVSHRVISGLLAFGSCGWVACDEPADSSVQPAPPPMATTAEREPEPPEPSEPAETPDEPVLDGDTSQLGTVSLQPGFMPDPLSRVGTAAAGPVDLHEWDDRCDGWVAEHPDAQLEVVRPFAELAIMAAADVDTTLMVVGPDGDARCVDDSDGPNPVLRATLDAGLHRIWVGTKEADATARFVLTFSEFDATTPADTLN